MGNLCQVETEICLPGTAFLADFTKKLSNFVSGKKHALSSLSFLFLFYHLFLLFKWKSEDDVVRSAVRAILWPLKTLKKLLNEDRRKNISKTGKISKHRKFIAKSAQTRIFFYLFVLCEF